jgi:Zn-dependent M28 family amino/carboxypeptidase
VPGRSLDTIVVTAHRDSTAGDAGLDDNASGTGALIELARAAGATRNDPTGTLSPNHTLVFVSTDAGAYGLLGARELAESAAGRTLAVIALDAIASDGPP